MVKSGEDVEVHSGMVALARATKSDLTEAKSLLV